MTRVNGQSSSIVLEVVSLNLRGRDQLVLICRSGYASCPIMYEFIRKSRQDLVTMMRNHALLPFMLQSTEYIASLHRTRSLWTSSLIEFSEDSATP